MSGGHRVIHDDCTAALRGLARDGALVDAVVTDPPYHLASIVARLGQPDSAPIQSGATGVYARSSSGFMGQQWDGGDIAFRPDTWRRVYDVMKPGAHLVAFAATKGYHRMACAIEDAGFEISDMLLWLYGTGFPKRHTLLKPAVEPIVFAQKPISEDSIDANAARWGVGAINIEACRIPADDGYTENAVTQGVNTARSSFAPAGARQTFKPAKAGRWPANVLHDGSDEVEDAFAAFGERGAIAPVTVRNADKFRNVYNGSFAGNIDEAGSTFQGDGGTAARFFYSSKATQGERIFECTECGAHTVGKPACGHDNMRTHPTVKPLSLMEWLVKLVCPVGGLVLDPFAGTGTTAAAARAAGMQSLSIEADANHVRDIGVRLDLSVDEILNAKVQAAPVDHGDQWEMFA